MTASPAPTLLSSEAQFYLPQAKGVETVFGSANQTSITETQARYVKRCAEGHDMMANAFLKMVQSSEEALDNSTLDVSLTEQLYRKAARIRRAIALELEHPKESDLYLKYGQPLLSYDGAYLEEPVVKDPRTVKRTQPKVGGMSLYDRYAEFYPAAKKRFDALCKIAEERDQSEWFGSQHYIKKLNGLRLWEGSPHLEEEVTISVFNKQLPHYVHEKPIASISYNEARETIGVKHATASMRGAMFELADAPLKRLIQNAREHQTTPWDEASRQHMWEDLAELSLHLYHNPPLMLGSQTATLMIIAGIAKACGLSPAQGKLETDHFLDAEIIPYAEYIQNYKTGFGKNFTEISRTTIAEPTHEAIDWIDAAHQKLATHFQGASTNYEKMTRYMKEILGMNVGAVLSVKVKNGKVKCDVVEGKTDYLLQSALDFVGHQDVIAMLGLSPEEKVSTAAVVWEKAVTSRAKDAGVRQP